MPTTLFSREYAAFVKHLVEARKRSGLTQKDVAARLKVPQARVSKCERGERRMDLVEVWQWCVAMGVPFADFVKAVERDFVRGVKR